MIAGVLITLWFLAKVFETQINTAPPILQIVLIVLISLVVIGAILLALWDTKVIGKSKTD